jgi:hypothetical protein
MMRLIFSILAMAAGLLGGLVSFYGDVPDHALLSAQFKSWIWGLTFAFGAFEFAGVLDAKTKEQHNG